MKADKKQMTMLTSAGLMAGMITLMTAYIFHIPYGANGGYVHFGDALIYLAAVLLPKPYALAAAAVGGGLADLLTAPVWAPATVIIKMCIVLCFTGKEGKILVGRNYLALLLAACVTVGGYYLAEAILFGSFLSPVASIWGNVVQATGSTVFFLILAIALDKAHIKTKLETISQ